MNLFENVESPKDQSPIEPVGNQPTQPIGLAYSMDERAIWSKLLKKGMKEEYGENAKTKNYSDFILDLLIKTYGEDS